MTEIFDESIYDAHFLGQNQQPITVVTNVKAIPDAKKKLTRIRLAAVLVWLILTGSILWLWNYLGGSDWRNTGSVTFPSGTIRVSGPLGQTPTVQFPTPFEITGDMLEIVTEGFGTPLETGQDLFFNYFGFDIVSGDLIGSDYEILPYDEFEEAALDYFGISLAAMNLRSGARLILHDGELDNITIVEIHNNDPIPDNLLNRLTDYWWLPGLLSVTLITTIWLLVAQQKHRNVTALTSDQSLPEGDSPFVKSQM